METKHVEEKCRVFLPNASEGKAVSVPHRLPDSLCMGEMHAAFASCASLTTDAWRGLHIHCKFCDCCAALGCACCGCIAPAAPLS